jgi:hypothetical protein
MFNDTNHASFLSWKNKSIYTLFFLYKSNGGIKEMKRRAAFAKGLLPSYRVGPFFPFFFFVLKKKETKRNKPPNWKRILPVHVNILLVL